MVTDVLDPCVARAPPAMVLNVLIQEKNKCEHSKAPNTTPKFQPHLKACTKNPTYRVNFFSGFLFGGFDSGKLQA